MIEELKNYLVIQVTHCLWLLDAKNEPKIDKSIIYKQQVKLDK